MTNRARSIDLPPAIQESCMNDLVTLCSHKLDRDEVSNFVVFAR